MPGENQCYIALTRRPSGEIRLGVRSRRVTSDGQGARKAPAPTLSIATNSKTGPKAGFGGMPKPTQFTRLGKRRVREGAAVIEKIYSKHSCRFLTGTLPGSTAAAYEYTARYSAWLIQQVTQYLRDIGIDTFCCVWELQKRGALHLHVLCAHTDPRVLATLEARWHELWVHWLVQASLKCGVDLFARESGGSWIMAPHVVRADCQNVRVSVSRYLAKYLSKSASKFGSGRGNSPSRWWSLSMRVRELIGSDSECASSVTLSRDESTTIFEVMAAELASVADVSFYSRNPVLPWCTTLIAYTSGANAEIVFDYLQHKLAPHAARDKMPVDMTRMVSPGDVAVMFSGELLTGGEVVSELAA